MPGPPASRTIFLQDLISEQHAGNHWYVDGVNGSVNNDGKSFDTAFLTVQAAITAAAAGDVIHIAPASDGYDEAVTIAKANMTLIGHGGRGSVFIAPSATNATGVLVTASDVTLINVGCDGDGTGPGLHVKGDVSRFRAFQCKVEGDDFGCRLESNGASASVADTWFQDCEFAWASTAFEFRSTGGADPVSQTVLKDCLFHNYATVGVKTLTVHTIDVWIQGCVFANTEDATEPTDYLLIDVASTTGIVKDCYFADASISAAKMTIAAGVLWVGNYSEAGLSAARPA